MAEGLKNHWSEDQPSGGLGAGPPARIRRGRFEVFPDSTGGTTRRDGQLRRGSEKRSFVGLRTAIAAASWWRGSLREIYCLFFHCDSINRHRQLAAVILRSSKQYQSPGVWQVRVETSRLQYGNSTDRSTKPPHLTELYCSEYKEGNTEAARSWTRPPSRSP